MSINTLGMRSLSNAITSTASMNNRWRIIPGGGGGALDPCLGIGVALEV